MFRAQCRGNAEEHGHSRGNQPHLATRRTPLSLPNRVARPSLSPSLSFYLVFSLQILRLLPRSQLALLATYYGVTVDNIASVTPDAKYSRCLTLKGPSGKEFTDFAKVGFTVTTKDGKTVTVNADRCGSSEGGDSKAIVVVDGKEVFRTMTPDDDLKKIVEQKAKEDPEMMPYFFLQSDDYVTLKERATAHILSGAAGAPEGMATIDIAVEALKCAEYLTPLLQEALKA